ncbi:hypothetical protein Y1Q_0001319 [Alligator mississippiensis]|uniref:Uncharacterized protein n=1 Tax=Alligator mississippiensis TaxID=8496 RepID=A0A151M903_ALLMI|nr:hypothetical protein Y1Q_0001319 [Alligator mississippiensis]
MEGAGPIRTMASLLLEQTASPKIRPALKKCFHIVECQFLPLLFCVMLCGAAHTILGNFHAFSKRACSLDVTA